MKNAGKFLVPLLLFGAALPQVAQADESTCPPGQTCPGVESFQRRDYLNIGLGYGIGSLLRVDYQMRKDPDRFWSLTGGTSIFAYTLTASMNWKQASGWTDSSYWILGGGIFHLSFPAIFMDFSITVPEVHGGWGYEWFTQSKSRHAVEINASYPQIVSVHYMYGF